MTAAFLSTSVDPASVVRVTLLRNRSDRPQGLQLRPTQCACVLPLTFYRLKRATLRRQPERSFCEVSKNNFREPGNSEFQVVFGSSSRRWRSRHSKAVRTSVGPFTNGVNQGQSKCTWEKFRARALSVSEVEAESVSPETHIPESATLGSKQNERGVDFYLGPSFYRAQSCLSRDLSVLACALYKRDAGQLRVLDVMSGSGIRALRYLRQGGADFVWANDACLDTHSALAQNLTGEGDKLGSATESRGEPGTEGGLGRGAQTGAYGAMPWQTEGQKRAALEGDRWRISHDDANKLLFHCYQTKDYFDLIDVDCFGSDSLFMGSALMAVKHGGLIYVTCTDGFSSGGHAPFRSLSAYGCHMRPLPYCNELGLRMLIGGAVREAAQRKLQVSPVFSHYSAHGPVFRAMLKVTPVREWDAKNYAFIAHCFLCGESQTVAWGETTSASCSCQLGQNPRPMAIVGPLWIGPLHSAADVAKMTVLAKDWGWIPALDPKDRIAPKTAKIDQELATLLAIMAEEAEVDLPPWYMHLDKISKMGQLATPRRQDLIDALRKRGFCAAQSHVEKRAVKSSCSLQECIDVARSV